MISEICDSCSFILMILSPQIDLFYNEEELKDSFTLCDVAYMFTWRRVSATLTSNLSILQGCPLWPHMGQIWDFLGSDFRTF